LSTGISDGILVSAHCISTTIRQFNVVLTRQFFVIPTGVKV